MKLRQFIPFLAADTVPVTVSLGQQILDAINAERLKATQVPLVWDDPLVAAAESRAAAVQAKGQLDHTGYDAAIKAIYPTFKWAGENLARFNGSDLATRVVSAWMGSPAHQSNLLFDGFDRCAVAEVIDSESIHWIAVEFIG